MTEDSAIFRPAADPVDARPDFIARLGLLLPCSEADVKTMFRDKVRLVHPDHGGTVEQFRQLEEDYQNALQYVHLQSGRRQWLAAHIERYAAQEVLIDEIHSRGGEVVLQSIDWLKREVGDDFAQVLDTIVAVRLNGDKITKRDVEMLVEHQSLLQGMKRLDLSGANIGNSTVSLLTAFQNLAQLDVSGTHVSNSAVSLLARIPTLTEVRVGHSFLGFLGRLRLRLRRPEVTVDSRCSRRAAGRGRYVWVAVAATVCVLLCFIATHVPSPDIEVPHWNLIPFDKVVHFSMFAGIGWMLSWLFSLRTPPGEQSPARSLFHALIVMAAASAYGMFDEQTQPAFGRTLDYTDWAADMTGAAAGVILFMFATYLFNNLRRSETVRSS